MQNRVDVEGSGKKSFKERLKGMQLFKLERNKQKKMANAQCFAQSSLTKYIEPRKKDTGR